MIPSFILTMWLLGLLSVGMLLAGSYLAHEWYQRSWGWDPVLERSVFDPQFGMNAPTAMLAGAVFLLFCTFFGQYLVKAVLSMMGKNQAHQNQGEAPETHIPQPASEQTLSRPDGSELRVRLYGAEDAPPMILTHGWGMHSDEWNYMKRELADRFRLIVWDEPGLGRSTRPDNRDYSLENLADDLNAVLSLAHGRPAILLGHSIGGMITLTFCRLFPEALRSKVAGLVLTNTTFTNPVRTTKGASLLTAIETPVLKPLCYLTIGLSPLVWLMNWMSYMNGTSHLMTKKSGFAGGETWDQIDFVSRFQASASPAVLARGMIGMMHYDATSTLPAIDVPTLVVSGDKDTVCKPEASERIRQDVPNAQLLSLAPAKHMGLLEHHRRFAEAIREFASYLKQPIPPPVTPAL